MKNKTIFTIIIIFILTIILFANFSSVQASALVNAGSSVIQPSDSASDDILEWEFSMDQEIPSKVTDVIGLLIALLRNISIIITILVIVTLGIKYMLGSVQEKAEYKKSFATIIIGVSLITLTTAIVDVIFKMVSMNTV